MSDENASDGMVVARSGARSPAEETPEQRLLRAGAACLSHVEVLSVLLRGGGERSALEAAER